MNVEITEEMQECIATCMECHAVCLETVSHCLATGGEQARFEHIRVLQDCAQICITAADFMLRMSDYYPDICDVCAEICERCADECIRVSVADEDVMGLCAEICTQCADSCRGMSDLMDSGSG